MLCFDVACPEVETLFVLLYYISHFQNGSTEVYLLENLVDEEYEPLKIYFHDEEVSFVGEDISEEYPGWRLFFYGAPNHQVKGIGAILVSASCHQYPMAAKH